MSNNYRARPPVPGPACEYFAPLLPLVGQEHLDPRDSSRLRQHLATCGYCQNELESYTWLDGALARHFGPTPRGPLSPADIRELTSHAYRPRTAPPDPLPAPALGRNHHQPRPAAPFRPARPQPALRGRRLISIFSALAAVLIIAAVSVALFESRAKPGNGGQQTSTPTAGPSIYTPRWDDYLYSIFMVSPGDGWAVGSTQIASGNVQNLILHYTGGHWQQVSGPSNEDLQLSGSALQRVFMVSATEGWAIGYGDAIKPGRTGTSTTYILHYTGGRWVPQKFIPDADLTDIFMASSTDGWATGAAAIDPAATATPASLLLHYNGKNWTQVQAPGAGLSSIAMTSASNGWIVGAPTGADWRVALDNSLLLHYDGSKWTQTPKPSAVDGIISLSMVSPTDGWAAGLKPLTTSVSQTSASLTSEPFKLIFTHYNGKTWSASQTPSALEFAILNRLFMDSSADGWAVSGDTYIHYSSGKWTLVQGPRADNLLDVYVLPTGEGWAVGSNGTIVHYQDGIWGLVASAPLPTQTPMPTATPTSTTPVPCTSHTGPNTEGIFTPVPFASWGTYTNTTYHYQLKYPANWVLDNLNCPQSPYLAFWNYNYPNWQGPGFPSGSIKIELYALDNPDGLSAMQFFQMEQQNTVGGPSCPAYTTRALQVNGHNAIEAACPGQNTDLYYIPDGRSMLRFAQATGPNVSASDVLAQMVNSLTFTS